MRLQRQAMSMSHYCSLMVDRAKMMLRFIEDECPADAGNVLTLFRNKYPEYGLRPITLAVTEKFGLGMCVLCVFVCAQSQVCVCLCCVNASRYKRSVHFHAMTQFYMSHG